jgi:hypothetical protein
MEAYWMGDDLDDTPVADLVPVAEQAVDGVPAPVLREPSYVRELVHQPGGSKGPAGDDGVPAGQVDAEVAVVSADHRVGMTSEDLAAVTADLLAPGRRELRRRGPLSGGIAVHMRGRAVARLAVVHDDNGPALTAELKGGGQAGG